MTQFKNTANLIAVADTNEKLIKLFCDKVVITDKQGKVISEVPTRKTDVNTFVAYTNKNNKNIDMYEYKIIDNKQLSSKMLLMPNQNPIVYELVYFKDVKCISKTKILIWILVGIVLLFILYKIVTAFMKK